MKKNIQIGCSLCTHKIAAMFAGEYLSLEELAQDKKLPSIKINDEEAGWLCRHCEQILTTRPPLKKVLKSAQEFANSAHVILPKQWTGDTVLVFNLKQEEEH